jgi:6-phosphofructokinase 2
MAPVVITVTLNPALDLSAAADSVVPGPKLRLDPPLVEPGGGGVNVSRAVLALGGQTQALVALGGATGARFATLLRAAGIEPLIVDLAGETRESLSVTDARTGQQYRFVLPGPDWDESAQARMLDLCATTLAQARTMVASPVCVLSGSQPPGVAVDFPQSLAKAVSAVGGKLVIDTSGAALDHLAGSPSPECTPAVLRMNRTEAAELAGRVLDSPAQTVHFARGLVSAGVAGCVVIARGADGSILVTATEAWTCTPPKVEQVSPIGAGDSFTAGLALGLARGFAWPDALALGTAAAAAAVTTPGSALCPRETVERLLPLCKTAPLSPA